MNTGRRARVPDGDLRDYDLACAQRHARYNACALNRALSIDRDLDLNDAFGNVCEIVGAFGRAHADYLARDHTRARILAGEIAAAVVGALDPSPARSLGRAFDLDHVRDLALALAREIDLANVRQLATADAVQGQRRAGRVAPLAGRLLAAAARLLPAGDRTRYAEEFQSELAEIARAGAGRRRQVAHAARVVLSARRLRADLRVPRRRGAAP
jgi:hypothetical protein